MCETSERENCGDCPSDCGARQFVCGNGVCSNSENCAICRQHCSHFAPKDILASLNSANSSTGSVLLSIRLSEFPLQFVVDDYLSEETATFEILNSVLASLDSRPTNIKEEKLLYEFAKINHYLDFEIEYIQGNQRFLADFLSRSPTSLMLTKKKIEAQ